MTKKRGFTLIEMLVVIAIIAILAGLLFPAVTGSLKTAKKARARAEADTVASAVDLYYNDYGRLPVEIDELGGSDRSATDVDWSKNVIQVLTAEPDGWNANHQLNPKRKVYLSMEVPTTTGEYLDPWGQQYRILMDLNLDGKIEYLTDDGEHHRKKAVVISAGPDEKIDKTSDNIANVILPEK